MIELVCVNFQISTAWHSWHRNSWWILKLRWHSIAVDDHRERQIDNDGPIGLLLPLFTTFFSCLTCWAKQSWHGDVVGGALDSWLTGHRFDFWLFHYRVMTPGNCTSVTKHCNFGVVKHCISPIGRPTGSLSASFQKKLPTLWVS